MGVRVLSVVCWKLRSKCAWALLQGSIVFLNTRHLVLWNKELCVQFLYGLSMGCLILRAKGSQTHVSFELSPGHRRIRVGV